MKKKILFSLLAGAIVFLLLDKFISDKVSFIEFYSKNLRASLFSGFLTAGSFLLSLKAFIVVKLKENVFDSQNYRANFEKKKKLKPDLTLYAPIRRLSKLLFFTILASVITSISQLSVGLFENWYTTAFCVILAVVSVTLFIQTLFLINGIIQDWLSNLDKIYEDEKAKSN